MLVPAPVTDAPQAMSQTWWFEWLSLVASVATIVALVIAVLSIWAYWRARARFTFHYSGVSADVMTVNIENVGEERAGNLVGLFAILDSSGVPLKGGDWLTLPDFPKGPISVVFYDPKSVTFAGGPPKYGREIAPMHGFRITLLWQAPVRRWQTRFVTATLTANERAGANTLAVSAEKRWNGKTTVF